MNSPRIVSMPAKKIIGMKATTSISDYAAPRLWPQFKPRKKEIGNLINKEDYSIQLYKKVFSFSEFTSQTEFEYWVGAEVSDTSVVPDGMEVLEIPEGKYAVFIHKGPVTEFRKTLHHIYQEWLPDSGYELEHRPHFEILGEKYLGVHHPDSEEEVWVPIKA